MKLNVMCDHCEHRINITHKEELFYNNITCPSCNEKYVVTSYDIYNILFDCIDALEEQILELKEVKK